MKVKKRKAKGKKQEKSPWWKKFTCNNNILFWITSRKRVELSDEDIARCKLICSKTSCKMSISKEVVESTLTFLRRKREDQLKMVREIKQVQFSGAEKMNDVQSK